jgi:GTPase-associated protein 1, N-terminal domain type 1
MSTVNIQQMVHGYAKGHGQLAASTRLPQRAADIVSEQSDLSGPLPSSASVPPYLSLYPLPETDFYALARTWPDADAPRSGCVITHTLLVPVDSWSSDHAPDRLTQFFRKPHRSELDRFTCTLPVSASLSPAPLNPCANPAQVQELVTKVFRDGLRSLVWFDCDAPEAILWSFLRVLWPALRAEVYANTFSLQPRARVTSEFQLHFAPSAAHARFHRFPRECHIAKSPRSESQSDVDSWIQELTLYVLSGNPSPSFLGDIDRYGYLLSSDPTSMRSLFLLRDLTNRLDETPDAALGILDILESLEPSPDRGINAKEHALRTAIDQAAEANADIALHRLYLVDARLRRPAFALVPEACSLYLMSAVCRVVANDAGAIFARSIEMAPMRSPYWRGVVDGLGTVAASEPSRLQALGDSPELASFAIGQDPTIAKAYLDLANGDTSGRVSHLAGWLHRIDNPAERTRLRAALLPLIADSRHVPLLRELLSDISAADVSPSLESLESSTRGFDDAALRTVVAEFVSERFTNETIQWGGTTTRFSNFAPEIVAIAFPASAEGLQQAMAANWRSPFRRCEILSSFIERVAHDFHLPQWLIRRTADDPLILGAFAACDPLNPRALRALEVIGRDAPYLPIARIVRPAALLQAITESKLRTIYLDKTLVSTIVEYIAGSIDEDVALSLFSIPTVKQWPDTVSVEALHEALNSFSSGSGWQRAWTTMILLPSSLFQRLGQRLPQVLAGLLRSYYAQWSVTVAGCWARLIDRAREELSSQLALRIALDSLAFCLNQGRLPVGAVVLSSFPTVYAAVSSNDAPQITDELFGYFDWDKAKKLRKDLIEAYPSSVWPPEELGLVAARSQILRKVFSRLRRKWHGQDYLARMVQGLRSADTGEHRAVARELALIMQDPDFFESWD